MEGPAGVRPRAWRYRVARPDPRRSRRAQATYGWPRVQAEVRDRGIHVSRKRVARLMRQAGLSGMVRRRKGRTTIRVPGVATAPDLVRRDFAPSAPNRLWVADLYRDRDLGGQALSRRRGRLL